MTVSPTLEFEGGEKSLSVRRVSVHERMSDLFTVDVIALSQDGQIDLSGIVGKGAGIAAETPQGVFAWTGVCNYMQQLRIDEQNLAESTYLLRIVPAIWLLGQRRNSRIFQHLTTQDILTKLLKEWNVEGEWNLTAEYKRHEYCVQYGETDLAFFHRLLEDAGITYYFKRVKAGDSAKSVLAFTDAPTTGPSVGPIDYYDSPNEGQTAGIYISEVESLHRVRTGVVTVRDYDFRKPAFEVIDTSEFPFGAGEEVEKAYELYSYRPGHSLFEVDGADDKLDVADDKSIARHMPELNKAGVGRHAEAVRHGKRTVGFRTNHPSLSPTSIFTIEQHPREQLGGKKLMVLETNIFINELDWALSGTAVFAEAPYRPERRTPRPRVAGIQTAMIVGPPGQEIYTDEFGRVRVRFHWDREGAFDDNSTCWLRVSQAWAGASFGSQHIPRIGQEVIVDFFEGDPDQPLVVGRVFNNTTKVPRKLPDHETQSIWRTASSPQTDGYFNEIMMEDKAGSELYFFQAQRDLQRLTKRNETERTGGDKNIVVGEGRVVAVAQSDSLQVGKQHLVKMVKVNDLKIPTMGDPDVTQTDTWMEMVDSKITLTTGDATIVLDGANITVDAKGGLRFTTDGRLVMKGSMVYLNVMAGQASVSSDKTVTDAVQKPDRMIGAVEEAFWKPHEAKLGRKDQTVKLKPKELPGKVVVPDSGTVEGRRALALEHMMKGPPERDAARAERHLTGINFDHPVELVEVGPDDRLIQYNERGKQGRYFAPDGSTPADCGITDDEEGIERFKQVYQGGGEPVTALRSTAAPIEEFTDPDGKVRKGGPGGGMQYQIATPEKMKEIT